MNFNFFFRSKHFFPNLAGFLREAQRPLRSINFHFAAVFGAKNFRNFIGEKRFLFSTLQNFLILALFDVSHELSFDRKRKSS